MALHALPGTRFRHDECKIYLFTETPKFVGMTSDEALNVGGHSVRVGATQGDMLALNIDLAP